MAVSAGGSTVLTWEGSTDCKQLLIVKNVILIFLRVS